MATEQERDKDSDKNTQKTRSEEDSSDLSYTKGEAARARENAAEPTIVRASDVPDPQRILYAKDDENVEVGNQGQQVPIEPPKIVSYGEEYQGKVINYGQQLQYECGLRGLPLKQLAEKLGTTVPEVQKWETDQATPDLASRQKLSQILGNDYYLSSEVMDNGCLRLRMVQRLLSAQDFTATISVLTWAHTQFWLVQQGHFADLDEYMQTQDSRFDEEANLIIDNLSSNSPALVTFLTDPSIATTAVASAVTLALALQKVVDAISKALIQVRKAQLDLQKEAWEVKRQHIESVLTTVKEAVDTLYTNADSEKKAMVMQAMLPNWGELLKEFLR